MRTIICHTCSRMWSLSGGWYNWQDNQNLRQIYVHYNQGHNLETIDDAEYVLQ